MTTANMNRSGVNSLQVSVTITKLKQQIANLQNQIAAQQAVYVKQQQSSSHGMGGGSTNDYLRGQHDAINSLQGTFTEMSMNKVTINLMEIQMEVFPINKINTFSGSAKWFPRSI